MSAERKRFWPRWKLALLGSILLLYVGVGVLLLLLVHEGVIERLPPTPIAVAGNDSIQEPVTLEVSVNLRAAEAFFQTQMIREDGHIFLYRLVTEDGTSANDSNTNSEAASYYLLWTAQAKQKGAFDTELAFVETKMLHPVGDYLQWRLSENGMVESDGGNIASDADLRAIRALLIAEKQWGDERYTSLIDTLARGLEQTAFTKDGLLAPYGGMSGTKPWIADESWLSYSDFTVFKALSERRGVAWLKMYAKMKSAVLGAQIQNGLYNSQITLQRQYGNGIDGGGYSINSMWLMARNAESGDPDLVASASRSLAFYKQAFSRNAEIDTLYDSNGDALSSGDAPWVYALIGRAAVALGDREFSDAMLAKLVEKQDMDCSSPHYGSFPEGVSGNGRQERVGQFTMQEAILTMQAYVQSRGGALDAPIGQAGDAVAACEEETHDASPSKNREKRES